MTRYKVWRSELMELDEGESLKTEDAEVMTVVVEEENVQKMRAALEKIRDLPMQGLGATTFVAASIAFEALR